MSGQEHETIRSAMNLIADDGSEIKTGVNGTIISVHRRASGEVYAYTVEFIIQNAPVIIEVYKHQVVLL